MRFLLTKLDVKYFKSDEFHKYFLITLLVKIAHYFCTLQNLPFFGV